MIYEYILLDEERMAKEEPEMDIQAVYKQIEDNAKKYNLKPFKGFYPTDKGIWVETDDSDDEYRDRGKFFMTLTLNETVMKYVIKWVATNNLENEDVFEDDDVLESMRQVKS